MRLQQPVGRGAGRGPNSIVEELEPGGEVGKEDQGQAQHGWVATTSTPEGQTERQGQGFETRTEQEKKEQERGVHAPPRSLEMESVCTYGETGSRKET